ncbi:unnamed protein product [Cylicostephanus goldi]|uniref:glycerol-3-phosphate dehydrogenase n=1 Tax=Cylicostephanus goldi TaxID=71465 RepID=A0A3P7N925_CYLGO|nr:unnamed protein product [Cylicostephanus goldi]
MKNEEGNVCGAEVKDLVSQGRRNVESGVPIRQITGQKWLIRARCVVNATGPSTDQIRQMADPEVDPICVPSSGAHIILPGYFCPAKTGMLDPDTSDGRVLFMLPWQGMTLAGTTDQHADITLSPVPTSSEVDYILKEAKKFITKTLPIRRQDVSSVWSGLRPLVRDPNKKDTKSLARNHIIEVSNSGLVTIAGGKWTTYRHMAEETVDTCVKVHHLKPNTKCVTAGLTLEGGHEYDPLLYIHLMQDYGLSMDIAYHLAHTYGDQAVEVTKMCDETSNGRVTTKRLHPNHPFLDVEV